MELKWLNYHKWMKGEQMNIKERKTQMYGCPLEAKHTQFAFEDPWILHMS